MEEQKAKKDITFILISGEPDVGKSRVCNRLHSMLSMNGTFTFLDKMHTASVDHIRYYEKDGKHIVVNSPSDNDKCMELFAEYLDTLLAQDGVRPDIIITSIREKGEPMYHMLALLEEVAKGTTNLLNYYKQNIASITSFAPTSLTCHAFVLHLEEQPVDDIENKSEETKALKPYMDDSADKIKYMIDFALARL